jgi:hypothetical protein
VVRGQRLAAFFAAGHDGGVEAFAKGRGKIVDFVRSIYLYGLSRGVENDFAVAALMKVLLKLAAKLGSDRVVDEVVKKGEKFCAGHFLAPLFCLK